MRSAVFFFCLLAVVLVVSGRPSPTPSPKPQPPSNWYISPFGSDRNTGKSAQNALLTLSEALDKADEGDIIHAANGLYNGDKNTYLGLYGVTLVGQSTTGTIFQGPPATTDRYIFSVTDATVSTLTLQGITPLSAGPGQDNTVSGVYVPAASEGEVLDVNFTNMDNAVKISTSAKSLNMKGVYADASITQGIETEAESSFAWETITVADSTFHCSSGVNLYSDGPRSTSTFSSLSFTNCAFNTCHLFLNFNHAPGNVNVDSCQFVNTTSTAQGGGIQAQFDANLVVTNCTFNSCNSPHEFGGGVGFASYTQGKGDLSVKDSTFTDCAAQSGGAIYAEEATLNVVACEFNSNEAFSGQGGAIATSQSLRGSKNSILGSFFTDNSASVSGGAISLSRTVSDSAMRYNRFSGNTAVVSGGAVVVDTVGSVEFTNITIEGSSAKKGGAISVSPATPVTIAVTQLIGNQALDGNGGGLFADSSTQVLVTASTFVGNSASLNGGGIAVADGLLNLHGAVFFNNTAVYGAGLFTDTASACNTLGTIYADNSASKSGGGFYCSQGGMNLSYAAFEDNEAPQGSSYTCAQNCQTYGSNVYNSVNGTVSGCNAIMHDEAALESVLTIVSGGSI